MHYMSNISSIMLWFFPLPLFSVEYYFISHELCYQFPLYLYMPTCVPPPIPFNCFFVVVQTCWPLVCRFDYCFVCCRSAKLGLRNVVWYLFRKKHCIVWKKKEDVLDYGLFTKGCHEKKKNKIRACLRSIVFSVDTKLHDGSLQLHQRASARMKIIMQSSSLQLHQRSIVSCYSNELLK